MNAEISFPTDAQLVGKRILCADDNRMVRESLRLILERTGYRVICAADGLEAWHLVLDEIEPFDLLITDQDMPNMCGLELVRRLNDEGLLPEVVVISGNLTKEIIFEYRRLGVNQLLEKPFLIATILAVVGQGCARAAVSRRGADVRAESGADWGGSGAEKA